MTFIRFTRWTKKISLREFGNLCQVTLRVIYNIRYELTCAKRSDDWQGFCSLTTILWFIANIEMTNRLAYLWISYTLHIMRIKYRAFGTHSTRYYSRIRFAKTLDPRVLEAIEVKKKNPKDYYLQLLLLLWPSDEYLPIECKDYSGARVIHAVVETVACK